MALTNSQYDAVMREFEHRRLNHERDFRSLLDKVYERFPRLKEIDDEISSLSIKKAQIALGASTDADFDLNAHINELTSEKKALLEVAGFKGGIAEPKYDCPICHDTGIVDGRTCSCFKQAGIRLLYEQSRLENVLNNENFETFDLSLFSNEPIDNNTRFSPRDYAKQAYDYARQFVDNFKNDSGNICLMGQTGVGKTFLSNCMAKALMDKGVSVLYFTASELFEILRENTFERTEESHDNAKLISECELLIIDDLGAGMNNSFISAQLFQCINNRLIGGKSTVISTNLSLSELRDEYSERLTSRIISNYKILMLYGEDLRQKKAFRGV